MAARYVPKQAKILQRMGQVIATRGQKNRAKVRVMTWELDHKLLKHYHVKQDVWVPDTIKLNVGDIVVVKPDNTLKSRLMTHIVTDVPYRIGQVVDPVTGRKCFGTHFADELHMNKNVDYKDEPIYEDPTLSYGGEQ